LFFIFIFFFSFSFKGPTRINCGRDCQSASYRCESIARTGALSPHALECTRANDW
jgi:hypothetical protein